MKIIKYDFSGVAWNSYAGVEGSAISVTLRINKLSA